jgi:hypothetical protein
VEVEAPAANEQTQQGDDSGANNASNNNENVGGDNTTNANSPNNTGVIGGGGNLSDTSGSAAMGSRARPLVNIHTSRKRKQSEQDGDGSSLQDMMKMFMLQRQQDEMRRAQEREDYLRMREEDQRRRDEEQRRRDDERYEDRQHRRANETMMSQMLIALLARSGAIPNQALPGAQPHDSHTTTDGERKDDTT